MPESRIDKIKELMKIDGIGKVTAEYLLEIGIESPETLCKETEKSLFEKFRKLKESGKISYQIQTVKPMIESAKSGNYKYSVAKQKYFSFFERNFLNDLHLLLFKKLIVEQNYDFNPINETFMFDDNLKDDYKKLYSDMTFIRNRNNIFDEWLEDKNNAAKIEILKSLYKSFFETAFSWDTFKIKYGEDTNNRECEYCKIKESDIEELILKGKIYTKRLYSRGKKMEVDRKYSHNGYADNNIAICCYWCNNAKSDEFTENEFNPIGEIIKKIWENRKTAQQR